MKRLGAFLQAHSAAAAAGLALAVGYGCTVAGVAMLAGAGPAMLVAGLLMLGCAFLLLRGLNG